MQKLALVGDSKLVGRGADIACGVVQDEVFKMDEFAVDPQRGARVGKMGAFDKPLPDR